MPVWMEDHSGVMQAVVGDALLVAYPKGTMLPDQVVWEVLLDGRVWLSGLAATLGRARSRAFQVVSA